MPNPAVYDANVLAHSYCTDYWKFNESSGTTFANSKHLGGAPLPDWATYGGSTRYGFTFGSVTLGDDTSPFGTDEAAVIPDTQQPYTNASIAHPMTDISFDFWIKISSSAASGNKTVFCSRGSGAGEDGLHVYIKNDGKVYVGSSVGGAAFINSSAMSLDAWHYVAVTKDNNDYDIWIDGVQNASATDSTTVDPDWDRFAMGIWNMLGTPPTMSNFVDGPDFAISRLASYGAKLTDEYITGQYGVLTRGDPRFGGGIAFF